MRETEGRGKGIGCGSEDSACPTGAAGSSSATASGAALSFEGLRVERGGRAVLDGLDYAVPSGAFTCVVGRNGCGKSTLLSTASGLLSPKAGRVRLCGRDLSAYGPRERAQRLALLAQSTADPSVRVRELVAYGRFPYRGDGEKSAHDQEHVQHALELMGIERLADAWVDRLSGGQRQRAFIALAIAQDTPVLLMDEPTTYLDISGCHDVLRVCRGLAAEGRTVVAVVHDIDLALRYADQVAVLDGGRIACAGTPSDVLSAGALQKAFDVRIREVDDADGPGYLMFSKRLSRLS